MDIWEDTRPIVTQPRKRKNLVLPKSDHHHRKLGIHKTVNGQGLVTRALQQTKAQRRKRTR